MDRPVVRDLIPIERVWARLEAVEEGLRRATTSTDPFLTRIAQHLLAAGGKRYRPLLAQVAAELGGSPGEGPVAAGVAVELVHLGSLYHDDVIDEASSRRGAVSVNANWSNTVAILAGDFLLARASETAAPLGVEAVALLARTYADLCEGQILELQLTGNTEQGTGGYFRRDRPQDRQPHPHLGPAGSHGRRGGAGGDRRGEPLGPRGGAGLPDHR